MRSLAWLGWAALGLAAAPPRTTAQDLFTTSAIPSIGPVHDVAIADLDQDGLPDLVATAGSTHYQSVLQVPAGTWTTVGFLDEPNGSAAAIRCVIADFDRDGVPDLAHAAAAGAAIETHRGRGDGSFEPAPILSTGLPGPWESDVVADLDGDGNPDFLASTGAGPIALGDGAGGFVVLQGALPDGGPCGAASAATAHLARGADLDLDGAVDFAWGSTWACPQLQLFHSTVSLHKNPWSSSSVFDVGVFSTSTALAGMVLALEDLDADGRAELVYGWGVLAETGPTVFVAALYPWFQVEHLDSAALAPPGSGTLLGNRGLAIADANQDGARDFLTAGLAPAPASWTLRATRRPGSAYAGTPILAEPLGAPSLGVAALRAADLDDDGRADVVLACGDATIRVLRRNPGAAKGLVPFGAGSAGCAGPQMLVATTPPAVGTTITLLSLASPRSALGMLVSSSAADSAGSDPFGVGILLHVAFAPAIVVGNDILSDAKGLGTWTFPIPNDPALKGAQAYLQSIWAWDPAACALPPFQLSASNGLALTIQ